MEVVVILPQYSMWTSPQAGSLFYVVEFKVK